MSAEEGEEDTSCCASCGVAEGDEIKLKKCNGCHLVRYCSVKCQREHRPKHKRACKERAAELRDEILFKQPEGSHRGDCPICCLPMPLDLNVSTLQTCCSKIICPGCDFSDLRRAKELQVGGEAYGKCPFCRDPVPKKAKDFMTNIMKRAEVNDPIALCQMGVLRRDEGDYSGAFQYLTKAADLGDAQAHYDLSCSYHNGLGVKKDKKKEVYHLEQAAIEGHVLARNNLGCVEEENGRMERAAKHWIIAVNLGHSHSLDAVKSCYRQGFVSKEDLAKALRAHQAALDAMKSPQRDEANAIRDYMKSRK
ncbi:zf-MYND and TPR domain-containing protein [Skeletonema marinoi]|uniref:Zf-MYND and TPR domain-containing protein n=1 Tax=Skeletonema marinoi TaxID=267567 RepID=A0AAD8YIS0_9STRA|nr:zf-MYND and TPR domain-containing protein [Skeletonema marinoi]